MRSVFALVLLTGCSFTPPGAPGAAGGGGDGDGDGPDIEQMLDGAGPEDGPGPGGFDAPPLTRDAPTPPADAPPPPPDAFTCPGGFAPGPGAVGGCYRYVAETREWFAAHADCAAEPGAHLVAITSAAENAHVLSLLVGDTIYFGITDAGTEGVYAWVTGEPVVYTNWIEGEGTSGSEDCGEMNATTGGWYDDQCDNARPYVCEYPQG